MRPTAIYIDLVLAAALGLGCVGPRASRATSSPDGAVVHAYNDGLVGVRAANPMVRLRVEHDPTLGEPVLLVEYPAASTDPASRDVRLDAETRDWSTATAIAFRVKSTAAIRFSVSFVDRNRVVYTAWANVQSDVWQSVRLSFDTMRPNPYFQPPDAKAGAPMDVQDVAAIAFSPQSVAAGSLALSKIVAVK